MDEDGLPIKRFAMTTCQMLCDDASVGGCSTCSVTSQYDYNLVGETPDPNQSGYLKQQLTI